MASAPAMVASAIAFFAFIRIPLKRLFVFDGVVGYPAVDSPKRNRNVPYMLKNCDLFDELPESYHDSAYLDRLYRYIPAGR
jgi:hypothetical protein